MWPRRNQAPAPTPSATVPIPAPARPNTSTRVAAVKASSSVLGATRPGAATATATKKPDDDCGWLLRAMASKKKKKTATATTTAKTTPSTASAPKSTTTANTTKSTTATPSTKAATSNRNVIAATTTKTMTTKKRPLDGTKSNAVVSSKLSKLPRGIGWSQPPKAPTSKTSTAMTSEDSTTTPPTATAESFDDVFAEVFGASKRRHAATSLDDDVPSLPISSSVFLPEHPPKNGELPKQPTAPSPVRPTTSRPVKTPKFTDAAATAQWDFSAPSAISLDAFAAPSTSSSSLDTNATTTAGVLQRASFSRYKDEQTSHSVSDNFVRLNMRKRFKGSTGKAKKRPAYLRSSGFEDPDEKAKRADNKTNATNGSSGSGGSGAFMDDGIDFIEECLEMLKKYENKNAEEADPFAGSTTTMTVAPPSAPSSEPPRCQHALVCTRVLVKKKNKNHGRAFFACPLGYDEGRCDYFLWEDNHSQFALQRLFGTTPASSDETTTATESCALASTPPPPAIDYAPLDLTQSMETQTKNLVTNLRLVFGHSDFRDGQQWAIQRVFEKRRTLLVLPTGAGKSLCYQYPALFLPGITIVISPLISLMNDQFHNLPPVLKHQATCVTTSGANSKTQYAEFVRDLLGGKLKLLFVSPEKALTSGFQRLLTQMQSRISLVCVDEAHCISEWSHHFRPSYLRLQSVFALADAVLAITATASRRVERDILSQLDAVSALSRSTRTIANDGDGQNVLRMPWQRDNLHLRVVRVDSDDERLEKLCDVLLKSHVSGAMIMYVHQQWQAEAMANLLQERLAMDGGTTPVGLCTGPSKTKSAKPVWTKHKIAAYHAKMDPETKEKVRLGFLSGRVKLVIATIAFGMGIDKQNVRLVIHYHVPSSIEHYLQQVGRAGRDGRAAQALLFLLEDDVRTFRSLLYSNSLHISQVQRLVELLVTSSTEKTTDLDLSKDQHVVVLHQTPHSSRVWMEVAWLEQHLDMKAAMVETFLTLLSLSPVVQHDMQLTIRPTSMSWCVISMMESQLRAPQADPILKRLVATLMDSDASGTGSSLGRYGHVEVDVDGYLRHLRVHFHVAALAKVLLPPIPTHECETTSSGSLTIDIQARRLMHSVRTWQNMGQIKKFQMEKTTFDVDVGWTRPAFPASTGRDEAERRRHDHQHRQQCVNEWTTQLYTKHEALEAMELKRLRHLYSALSSAASPLGSSLPINAAAAADAASSHEQDESRYLLEQKLSSYFDDDQRTADKDDRNDADRHGDHDETEVALWRSLTATLSGDLVDAIERDIDALTSRPPNAVIEQDDDRNDDAVQRRRPRQPLSRGAGSMAAKETRDSAMETMAWHGHNVARIFHGLASPCFPSKVWRDQLWWRKYAHVAFEQLVVIADKVLLANHGHDEQHLV